MSFLPVFNVQTFGAFGDGVHDDTGAIQDAMNAVPPFNPIGSIPAGGIVYFPEGNYLISQPLLRQQPNTACIGAGKDATVITLNQPTWSGAPSPADPSRSYMLDLSDLSNTDCTVTDLTLNGRATDGPSTSLSKTQCGILISSRNVISRVNLYDIWGYGLWIFGPNAQWARVLDCEAWLGSNPQASSGYGPGNDCIGGGGTRTLIERFHWASNMAKNTALDFQSGGGPDAEVSVDIIDCINESAKHVALEGAVQSSI